MPCTGKTAKSDLPIINSRVMVAKAESKPREKKKRIRTVVDFHCPVCGLTKPAYSNYRHVCPGEKLVPYQCQRKAICAKCDRNKDGVCESLQAIQPDAPCLVSIGVAMPGAKCPDGKWQRVIYRCDKCGSARFDAGGLVACPVCRQG